MTFAEVLHGRCTLWGLITPRAIDRFRPALIAMEFSLFLVGCLFWLNTQMGGDNFSPETYGEWACMLPAACWAASMMLAGALVISGLMHPITRGRIIIGCALQVVQFLGLSVSAIGSGGQFVITIFPLLFFVPLHLVLAWEAAVYDPNGNA